MKQIHNGDICTVDFQKAIKTAGYSFGAFKYSEYYRLALSALNNE